MCLKTRKTVEIPGEKCLTTAVMILTRGAVRLVALEKISGTKGNAWERKGKKRKKMNRTEV